MRSDARWDDQCADAVAPSPKRQWEDAGAAGGHRWCPPRRSWCVDVIGTSVGASRPDQPYLAVTVARNAGDLATATANRRLRHAGYSSRPIALVVRQLVITHSTIAISWLRIFPLLKWSNHTLFTNSFRHLTINWLPNRPNSVSSKCSSIHLWKQTTLLMIELA